MTLDERLITLGRYYILVTIFNTNDPLAASPAMSRNIRVFIYVLESQMRLRSFLYYSQRIINIFLVYIYFYKKYSMSNTFKNISTKFHDNRLSNFEVKT